MSGTSAAADMAGRALPFVLSLIAESTDNHRLSRPMGCSLPTSLPDCGIDWDSYVADYDRIRDKIEAVFPELFTHFNNLIRRPGGFHLTIPPRQRVWNTATGRANFLVFSGVEEDAPVSNPAMLRLATLRSHDQYNTTIYGIDDRYRGVFGGAWWFS